MFDDLLGQVVDVGEGCGRVVLVLEVRELVQVGHGVDGHDGRPVRLGRSGDRPRRGCRSARVLGLNNKKIIIRK